jgi:DNA-binding transcriptional ArsR family regulator
MLSIRRDSFQAISDPTRRKIIHILVQKALNLNDLADHFPISRPAISKHVKILAECGLIIIRQEGRERFCEANLKPLGQVAEWIEPYRLFWTKKLDSLEVSLKKGRESEEGHKRKKTKANESRTLDY